MQPFQVLNSGKNIPIFSFFEKCTEDLSENTTLLAIYSISDPISNQSIGLLKTDHHSVIFSGTKSLAHYN
jgi:hypothetical protein